MKITKKLIKSFLPVFPGFYETLFAPEEDSIIEEPYNFDDYEFDYDGFRTEMAKACCDAIETELKPLGIKVIFEEIRSPRFYNFDTDSINVTYKLSAKTGKLLYDYLQKNIVAFTKYIKDHYTSRDGFNSFWSNDVKEWFDYEYTQEENKLKHTFGAMLEFYFENEGYTTEDLYYATDSVYLDGGLKEGVHVADKHIRQYAKDNYIAKAKETIVIELCEYFVNEGIEYDFLTFGYIDKIVSEVFAEIDSKTLNLFAKK